jgi:hypothetical protein
MIWEWIPPCEIGKAISRGGPGRRPKNGSPVLGQVSSFFPDSQTKVAAVEDKRGDVEGINLKFKI